MGCITSVSFSFLLNGEVRGNVIPERGLRQGYPLSPFIFVLCAEALSGLIVEAEQNNLIEGICFGRRGVKVSHLFFVDDNIMFLNADGNGSRALKDILHRYTTASGQMVNFSKSEVCFGSKVDDKTKREIAEIFEVKTTEHFEKYLGIPGLVGRSKRETFKPIKDRIWNKIKGWKRSLFSAAGKEILIKVVVQAMPTYAMNCFRLPLNLINNIHSIAAKFWWGSTEKKRKIHWCKWEELCKRKDRGGLGFKDMELFNQAMLAKQCWRLERYPDSLVSKVLRFSYHSECNFLQAKLGSAPSYIWRSLLWGRRIIEAGSRWRIGSREEVRIMEDKWLPRPSKFTFLEKPDLPSGLRVIDLRKADGEWDENFIRNIFIKEDADCILSIAPGHLNSSDKRIWHYNHNGDYSVRSGYQVAIREKERAEGSDMKETERWWRKCWYCRNNEAFRKWSPEATTIVDWSANYLEEFVQSQAALAVKTKAAPKKWTAPAEGEIKINVDAAVNKNQGHCCSGVVIRNSLGEVIASSCTFFKYGYDPLVAELLAIQQGIKLTMKLNIKGGRIESDCSLAVGMLNIPPDESGDLDLLVSDIQRETENQRILSVRFAPRSTNNVAHMIAKYGMLYQETSSWVGSVPQLASLALAEDTVLMGS
ncbi:uncharacterized protein LOC133814546 [Humulus lupulus]|uniref:uncharacterized protein LOC133814546 n=1 Tax=Humulus lupulus TaxID=3486 RepID=UPI002B404B52|nr:uncharacterized protein LOC133814546 [Humulus lupulus]